MVSGSTALTVAFVPTATNAGVWMSPCSVWMTPVRPRRPRSSASTVKNGGSVTQVSNQDPRGGVAIELPTAGPVGEFAGSRS